jgi:hypothetical protein
MRLALACIFLVGCSTPDVVCGPFSVYGRTDCADFQKLERLLSMPVREALNLDPEAAYSFEEPWPDLPPLSFFQGATVVYQDSPVNCSGAVVGGCATGSVVYLHDPGALGHEVMHLIEHGHLVYNPRHSGWDTNGYYNFGVAFAYKEAE